MQALTTDILQAIFTELESTADLLSVALTSRELFHVVIPDQLDFRIIRCGRRYRDVWKFLLKHPKQCAQIREIELLDEHHQSGTTGLQPEIRVPRHLKGWKAEQPRDRDALSQHQCISDAISLMPRLQSFRWLDGRERPSELFFRALRHSPNLRRLEVLDHQAFHFTPYEDHHEAGHSPSTQTSSKSKKKKAKKPPGSALWQIRRLRSFSYTRNKGSGDVDDARAAINSLPTFLPEQGRHLVDLHLFHPGDTSSNGVSFMNLFAHARWPNLKRLTVGGYMFNEGNIQFFSHHTKLEVLRIFDFPYGEYNFLPLRNLKSLDVDIVLHPESLPAVILKRLDHLGVSVSTLEDEDTPKIFENAKQIRSLILRQSDYDPETWKPSFSELAKLEKLAIVWEDWDGFTEMATPEELIDCLAALPKSLTHLRGVCTSIWGQSDPDDLTRYSKDLRRFDPALRALSSTFPNLRFVAFRPQFPLGDELDWVVINRDRDGQYESCNLATHRHARDIDYEKWGDCYVGAQEVVPQDTERLLEQFGESDEEPEFDPENWREWAEYNYYSDSD